MGRRIVACAALLALVVSLSACACPAWTKSGSGGAGSTSGSVCVPTKSEHYNDCSACYRSEAERDMGRLRDDLPPGGCCCDCPVPVAKKHEYKECCAK
jgi:hypothetical protein